MPPDPQTIPAKPQHPVSLPILNAGLKRTLEVRIKDRFIVKPSSDCVVEDNTNENKTIEVDDANVQQGNNRD